MSNTEATRKQLKIKSGVVKRYQKELTLYNAEIVEHKQRLASATAAAAASASAADEEESKEVTSAVCYASPSWVAGGDEPWEVRNAKSLIRESENMVRDTATRLERAAGELGDLVKRAKENAELEQDAELLNAEEVLAAGPSA
ncbi:hypothetical protein EI94DRAFT_1835627 [Lactarius quietus]|nr:hypothetical protein EI94DRAFT_1835627 [Lactarius quietus]